METKPEAVKDADSVVEGKIEPKAGPIEPEAIPVAPPSKPPAVPSDVIKLWAPIVISIISLVVSIIGYFNSKHTTDLTQAQFDADRNIVAVAEKIKDSDATFKFRALNTNQQINRVTMYIPAPFHDFPIYTEGSDQQLKLDSMKPRILAYYTTPNNQEVPPAPTEDNATESIFYKDIPVVLFMKYSVAGETRERQGIYAVRAKITTPVSACSTRRFN